MPRSSARDPCRYIVTLRNGLRWQGLSLQRVPIIRRIGIMRVRFRVVGKPYLIGKGRLVRDPGTIWRGSRVNRGGF